MVVEKRDQLEKLQLSNLALPVAQGAVIAKRQVQSELAELKRAESKFYQQKTKVRWLNEGDQGTKIFHVAVVAKRRKNTINSLLDDGDNRLLTFDGMAEELIRFFTCQIGTIDEDVGGCSVEDLKDILRVAVPVDAQMDIIRDITDKEIKDAIFAQGSDKAPGPDGFTAWFFKVSRSIVGSDFICHTRKWP
ncbi:hypothetical protein V6N13_043983 [Hibiscus sabdariffa]